MKKLLFFSLLMVFNLPLVGQQVHQQGTVGVDFSISRTGVGVLGGVAYTNNFSDQGFIRLRALGEWGRLYNFKYAQYGADVLAYYSPFYISDFFQFNLAGGVTGGYERVSGITKEKAANIGFQFGFKGGAELEAFLGDQLSFFVNAQQAYMLKKSLGRNYYEVGIGIRIFLNNYY